VPYPNIYALHHIPPGGGKVVLAGPLQDWYEEDLKRTRVFAFVTQDPTRDRAIPQSIRDDEPSKTATARGDLEFGAEDHVWTLEAVSVGDGPAFEPGWAFVTAVAVNFNKHGQLQTYSWSRWSYLSEAEVELT
jgi:hypothetical protein